MTDLRLYHELFENLQHLPECLLVSISLDDILQYRIEPIGNAIVRVGIGTKYEELLEQRIRKHGNQLVGQLDLVHVLHEPNGALDFLQRDRVLVRSAPAPSGTGLIRRTYLCSM